METLLEVRDIHTFIGQYHILQGVSLSVRKGSVLALLGRNGAGKTTTLKTILGLTPPREGEVIFGGRPIHEMRSLWYPCVFQERRLCATTCDPAIRHPVSHHPGGDRLCRVCVFERSLAQFPVFSAT